MVFSRADRSRARRGLRATMTPRVLEDCGDLPSPRCVMVERVVDVDVLEQSDRGATKMSLVKKLVYINQGARDRVT
jgi:hypothetical protein